MSHESDIRYLLMSQINCPKFIKDCNSPHLLAGGISFPNSISVSAGDDILIARDDFLIGEYFSTCISSFEYVFQDDLVNQNGDDAVELFKGSDVIETFGDINIDGTGTVWEYTDSWAYKDASGSATFGSGNWIFGGINCTDGTATIFESSCLYPLCQ